MALKDLPVPLPPFEKQQKIVKKIQEAYEQKKKKEAEIKMILAKIDSFVLGELGIEIEREREEIAFAITSDEIEGRIDPFFYKPYFKTLQRVIEAKSYAELGELVEFAKETWDQKTTLPCSPYFPLYFFLDLSGKSFRLKPLALSLSLIPSFLLILSILAKRNPY